MVGVPPSGTLPPFRVVNDYSGNLWDNDLFPSRGSRIPFYPKVASSHFRSIYSFRSKKRLSNISSKQFSRGHSENHRDPEGSKGDRPYSRRDTGSDFEKRDRSNKRLSEFMFVPDVCDPQEIGDLRFILNLKEFNLFILTQHFRMETLNVFFHSRQQATGL